MEEDKLNTIFAQTRKQITVDLDNIELNVYGNAIIG